jgi:hypothetical protein
MRSPQLTSRPSTGRGCSRSLRAARADLEWQPANKSRLTASGFANRASMQKSGADTPEQIADRIIDGLGKRSTVLPSARSKLLRWSVLTIPRRSGRVWIMGNVIKEMTKHRTDATGGAQ